MSDVTPEEPWRAILRAQAEKTSITDVARQLGYSRPAISLVLSGDYAGATGKIAAKVIACFTDSVHCPHLTATISQARCGDHQSRAMPTSDPDALRHWIACRSGCPNSHHGTDDEVDHA
ncbi:hypothetical protein AN189_02985 [Loktanella sp. 3ANDIMAR09]|uniref:hypothetical protein n=1 Tax=Loktanella sp. 3ANDIMAR09 TaxID=1225657 RepID=UPI0006FAECB7|nr:hypothetical protein [Loktanella sp. 3ANDIMAR09]KQI69402.1 hypothetical protein AN189_02985 [Loktanella sp. 3ANDIMAR09]